MEASEAADAEKRPKHGSRQNAEASVAAEAENAAEALEESEARKCGIQTSGSDPEFCEITYLVLSCILATPSNLFRPSVYLAVKPRPRVYWSLSLNHNDHDHDQEHDHDHNHDLVEDDLVPGLTRGVAITEIPTQGASPVH